MPTDPAAESGSCIGVERYSRHLLLPLLQRQSSFAESSCQNTCALGNYYAGRAHNSKHKYDPFLLLLQGDGFSALCCNIHTSLVDAALSQVCPMQWERSTNRKASFL